MPRAPELGTVGVPGTDVQEIVVDLHHRHFCRSFDKPTVAVVDLRESRTGKPVYLAGGGGEPEKPVERQHVGDPRFAQHRIERECRRAPALAVG